MKNSFKSEGSIRYTFEVSLQLPSIKFAINSYYENGSEIKFSASYKN